MFTLALAGCGVKSKNPLLSEWDTPFNTPPFDEIGDEHFMPAFQEAMSAHLAEIDSIVKNPEEPTFENTIEALEKSGETLERVERVFSCLDDANTNDGLQAISEEVEPLLAKHNDDISLDPRLFARVKKIYRQREDLGLNEEESTLLENVYKFLNDLWTPALDRAKAEAAEMQAIIDREGGGFKLAGWDWWYYAEKLRKEKYALDDAMLRPYFKMENVRRGAFDVAQKLYGIEFVRRDDIQTYHPDVEVFEVREADGRHLGIFYTDYFPRDGKRAGAWSGSLRSESNIGGRLITPLVFNVGNFTKPTTDEPALLSIDEVQTLFHELGHALNSLFADTVYAGSRRTPRDFVELPSQIMENWATDPEVLPTYALHYETGEPIPQELISKLQNARIFNQGFRTVEYLAASFLDMDWHSLVKAEEVETANFESDSMNKIGLMDEIASRYQSTDFAHIFDGTYYSAGYYSYIWAEVLDADAFQAFKEAGLFNRELAASFRKNLLSHGSNDMMAQYIKFRGAEPKVEPLLVRRGLK